MEFRSPSDTRRTRVAGLLALAAVMSAPCGATAESPQTNAKGTVDFVREVQPLFKARCWECHGENSQEGGLRLDHRKFALRGGDRGTTIVPGKSAESRLMRYVAKLDPDIVMPPEGEPLSEAEVAIIRDWIDEGAVWPEQDSSQTGRNHWSFQPIVRPALPTVKNEKWGHNPIDCFVAARLDKEGLSPSTEADRPTLIRRLSLDLIGLPPSPDEVIKFVTDNSEDAYERLVDRLLASPHFGERWAVYWLDLARYANSNGYDNDEPRPQAWRYRQWVIEAINRDMPLDQFGIEQLAGDLLPNDAPGRRTERLVATGFQRNSPLNTEGGIDREEFRVKTAVDRVNTIGTVWLGLTVGCAQCHAHKYDPISQRDFYGLLAFYNSINEIEIDAPSADNSTVSPKALAMVEADQAMPTHVMIRGDYRRPGAAVEPTTPEILPALSARGQRADRLDLARWLFDPRHPLTARVTANRIWHHLFGSGLVRTVEDYGIQGELPTHPELLDYLASQLIERGWSHKALIKQIVESATYRQSSQGSPTLLASDPENRLLARQNRWRPEAEIVRDLSLSASGLLHASIGGPSVQLPLPSDESQKLKNWSPSPAPDCHRRGVYVFVQRAMPLPMLSTFDSPDRHVTCACRHRSNTPLQALALLNDHQFFECARALGLRLLRESPQEDVQRISLGFMLCLSREPTAKESERIGQLLSEQRKLYEEEPSAATKLLGDQSSPEGIQAPEAAAWIAVARVLLNLDELGVAKSTGAL